jgi:hypothetical protein
VTADESDNLIGLARQYTFTVTQADASVASGVAVDFSIPVSRVSEPGATRKAPITCRTSPAASQSPNHGYSSCAGYRSMVKVRRCIVSGSWERVMGSDGTKVTVCPTCGRYNFAGVECSRWLPTT